MRPGQTAPEFTVNGVLYSDDDPASMRPGQTAPEFDVVAFDVFRRMRRASMRPGQTAPEFCLNFSRPYKPPARFNEAGADCPGIPQPMFRMIGDICMLQ